MPLNESFTEREVYELRKQVAALAVRITALEGTRKPSLDMPKDDALIDLIHRYAAREATAEQVGQALVRHDRALMKATLKAAANRFREGFDGDDDVVVGLRLLADDIK